MTEKRKRGRPKKTESLEKVVKKATKKKKEPTKLVTRNLDTIEDILPDKRVDFRQLLYWMDLGATCEEVAGAFHVSVTTLTRLIEEKTGFTWCELKEKCCGSLKIRLRENQFKMSETNPTMAIWLGKTWLGQREPKAEHEVTVNPAQRAQYAKEKSDVSDY